MKCYLTILIGIVLLLPFIGCIQEAPSTEKTNSISIAIDQDILGFYPWTKSYELYTMLVNRNIYNSLVEFDEIFRILPSLAQKWNNPDEYTWRFYLRENVTFHNGNPFTAHDVKYTIDLIRENESEQNQLQTLLKLVARVDVLDNHTVDIRTTKPCPILLNLLTDIFILSKQYQTQNALQQPVGTGSYRLVNYTKGESIHLQRYDGFWKKDVPDIQYVTFKVIQKNTTKALLDHEVDIAFIIPRYLKNHSADVSVRTIDNPTIAYLSFDFRDTNNITGNNQKNPFADVRVRKAIYQAINIDSLLNNTTYWSNCSQFVISLIFGYNPAIKRPPYDIDTARLLMEEAGYENGFSVIFDYSSDVFPEEIITGIHQHLSMINITLIPNALSYENYLAKLTTNNLSFYANCWTTGTGDSGEIYDYLIGTKNEEKDIGTYNVGLYSNSQVDMLGENASVCMDKMQRQHLLQECFQIAMDDVAWIPLFTWKISYGINDKYLWTPRADQQILVEYIQVKN